jgi:mercuric ion transport protein
MMKAIRAADSAGVLGAIFAALCCAGLPLILSVLATIGLSSIRRDSVLMPLMAISLGVAFWGFLVGRRLHLANGPIVLALLGSAGLVAGVVYIHGFPAKEIIWAGAIILVAATVWNIRLRGACATGSPK